MIDCGEGTQIRLRQLGINPMKIRGIFISHLHGDHVFGLPGLLSTMNFLRRRTPLHIVAPAPVSQLLEHHYRFFDREMGFDVITREIDARESAGVYENNSLEVTSVPLRHSIPCSGYLFREREPGLNVRKEKIAELGLSLAQIQALKRGEDLPTPEGTIPNDELTYRPYTPRSYAYCSDTAPSGKAAARVRGVDLLYHESTYLETDKKLAKVTGHTTTAQAAEVARKAGAGRLLIGHFSSRYKDLDLFLEEARAIFPCTLLAREGETVAVPQKRTRF